MGDPATMTETAQTQAPAAANATTASAASATATPAAAAPAAAVDPAQAFQAALAAHDSRAAIEAWNGMKAKERKPWKATDKVLEMMDGVGNTAIRFMSEAGATFKQSPSIGAKVLADPSPETWVTPMMAQSVFTDFTKAGPSKGGLDEAQAGAVAKMIGVTAGSEDAKGLFGKAYPKLKDSSYDSSWLWCRAWTADDVKRMVKAVVGVLPHQHMQTITGGFYIGTHVKESGDTKKKDLGYAFYHDGRIVMPSDSTLNGGGDTHDMVLGGRSHDDPLSPGGLAGWTDHFDGSALHEVGHGVGAHTDGNSWATSLGYTNWKKETRATFQQKLWDSAAADAAVAAVPKKDRLTPAAARDMLTGFIKTRKLTPPKGWKQEDAVNFVKTHYDGQKLYQYARSRGHSGDDYKFSGDNNVVDGRVYVYLSRWDESFASYTRQAFDEKVSWYSVSSPLEWFAEQYSYYYQLGPNNAKQPQLVKDKLKAIHTMQMKDGSLKAKKGKGGGGAGGGATSSEDRAPPGAQGTGSAPPNLRRAPFAW